MKFIVDSEINLIEKDDILETKRYAESLKETILNAPTPFNIGLYGEWGSGKSSIIKTAQIQLESEIDKKIKFVNYDAWKYANDSFRRMFLKTLQEQLDFTGTNFFDSFYQNTAQDKKIEQKFNWKYLWLIIGFGLSAILLTYLFFDTDKQSFVITIQAILTMITALTAFFKNAFTDYKITISKPAMFAPEQFEDAFREIITWLFEKKQIAPPKKWISDGRALERTYEKLVIVVDNIDRCDKKTAYELLTNIKNFIGKKEGVIFLVPVDDEALKRHMQEHNKENGREADEFLRKFFNTTIKIKHFQPRDLFEFANKLNEKHTLGLYPDTINIVAKEYASNPRRIIQLFNNLTSELKTIEAKHGGEFTTKYQSLIAKLLIIREEWADTFKEITKYPHELYSWQTSKIETFKIFMGKTKAITSDINTVEKIILNITNEGTLSSEIINLVEENNFEELKIAFEKNDSLFDSVVKYAIEELKKGIDRKTYSTDAINGIVLLSKLNTHKELVKAPLNDVYGFFDQKIDLLSAIEHLQEDDLDGFFKFVEQNRVFELYYLQDTIVNQFKEVWKENPKSDLEAIWKEGVYQLINNSSDEKAIKDLQSVFIKLYNHFSNYPMYKHQWINENKLSFVVSDELVKYLIDKITPPTIDIKSNEYLELDYFAKYKLINISTIENLIKKIKPNFSQPIQAKTSQQEEQQEQIKNLFINISAVTSLLKNIEKQKVKSDTIIDYIQEFQKQVQIVKNNQHSYNQQQLSLNILNDISIDDKYQKQLLDFYLEIYRATLNNTNVLVYIQALVNKYLGLKNSLYAKLIELRDGHQSDSTPFFDYLVRQNDKNENLFDLYEKLFNRDDLNEQQINVARTKLNAFISELIAGEDKIVENFVEKLMLQTKTKELLTDIIVSRKADEIIKLPHNIKKVAYQNLCTEDKIFEIENNIDAILDIVKSSDRFNSCILKIIKSKLLKHAEVGNALKIIDGMQNISDETRKEILAELKNNKKHESLADDVDGMIKKLSPRQVAKKTREYEESNTEET